MKPRLTLITGGARSGKSAYAAELAARLGAPTLYVATAEAGDAEMAERIRRHRSRRPRAWRTLEEPLKLAQAVASHAASGTTVIVDCLSLWLSNVLGRHVRDADRPGRAEVAQVRRRMMAELDLLRDLPERKGLSLIVVSNEVGAGLVPPYPLGRVYRDLLGEANQAVARRADELFLLVAGIPVNVKALAAEAGPGPVREA